MESLIQRSTNAIRFSSLDFMRYLYDTLEWNERCIAIKGARGTGKTTMLLQYMKKELKRSNALYLSLDDLYFTSNSLYLLADDFSKHGGTHLFLDEVHKYPTWSQEIKNIYDAFPKMKIVFSSSSALHIDSGNADLSRRAVKYNLQSLSFREYLELFHNIKISNLSLSEILKNHMDIALELSDKFLPVKLFEEYMKWGAYPFLKESQMNYYNKIRWTINQIIENYLLAITKISYESIIKLKKLLMLISKSVPFTPNISELSIKVGTSRDQLLLFLQLLEDASLIIQLRKDSSPTGYLTKPEKIFLANTVLLYAINESVPEKGTLRETFFIQHFLTNNKVTYTPSGDFMINEKYTFEIGGRNKSFKQIKTVKNSYVVADNLEIGYDRTIPLWLFGFLY